MINKARQFLRAARRIAVLTGAGISAESGVPTFRGPGGLWRDFKAEDLATPEAFQRDPQLVWEWYEWRRGIIAGVQPNPGHIALAELESRTTQFTLITQNVDGLHALAGSRNVLEVHGSIWKVHCLDCGKETTDRSVPLPVLPPRCPCGGMLRPGVVWFGEALPDHIWEEATRAVGQADVLLVVGTSAVVYPAAGLMPAAAARGARIIEVNLEVTPASSLVDVALRGAAGELLPQLIA